MEQLLAKVFRLHRRVKRCIELLVDTLLLSTSFCLALVLKQDSLAALLAPETWSALLLGIPVSLFVLVQLGFYRTVIRYSYLNMGSLKALLLGVASSVLVFHVVSLFTGLSLSSTTLLIYGILAMLTVGGVRYLLRTLYHLQATGRRTRVAIYGAGACGSQLAALLRQSGEYLPVAFVDDWRGMHGTQVEGLQVYPSQELHHLINHYSVERILLAIPSTTRARRREILETLAPLCVPIQTVPGMEDVVSGRALIQDIRDVAVEDLLGRDPVPPMMELLDANIRAKVVMVTGAGGSIGSELCRQILRLRPRRLVLLDNCEYSLYAIEAELRQIACLEDLPDIIEPLLGSVQQRSRLEGMMRAFQVQTVYHAAAYKHVPIVEFNVIEGVRNNVFGTLETARAAISARVETFVLISTDKAVRPTNVMGTTKRLAELICQALSMEQSTTRFCMVRFGNVLGSSGSVIPLFRSQIARGGPITVTHRAITRYFMTIPEAAMLVLQAGAMGKGGDVFVLDMGSPVEIAELARRMVYLSGLEVKDDSHPGGDIEIQYTGLRPGEKLYEELLVGTDVTPTRHPRILSARETCWKWMQLDALLIQLQLSVERGDIEQIRQLLLDSPTSYQPQGPIVDLIWQAHSPRGGLETLTAITPPSSESESTASSAAERDLANIALLKGYQ
ncbi:polysaccharide biosynthesis protein [Halomonas heilongjiangensis]|uniref:Nucleoside-diphosphate sugar epimerase n=1 Tax=Halomonas heilongjiangensis TaxID=1387883 RepID=A0A2N7TUJ7_9GAMM|nr:nucleoside-diphosphate sugar epimerase/dehydratase [Halomonas heilongjiangensis]PMR71857.1 nucleoside-diphosphate sugar epimerase [Halomonas heilongjiangensis]PXX87680.1 nucleoside-diphosphate sugar epimerase [Halomonas heilongjiangensis]